MEGKENFLNGNVWKTPDERSLVLALTVAVLSKKISPESFSLAIDTWFNAGIYPE